MEIEYVVEPVTLFRVRCIRTKDGSVSDMPKGDYESADDALAMANAMAAAARADHDKVKVRSDVS